MSSSRETHADEIAADYAEERQRNNLAEERQRNNLNERRLLLIDQLLYIHDDGLERLLDSPRQLERLLADIPTTAQQRLDLEQKVLGWWKSFLSQQD